MAESGRPWTAVEIGEEYLKIPAASDRAAKLIRGVIAGDPRFREIGEGLWSSVASSPASLRQAEYLVAWLDTCGGQTPDSWVLWLRSHGHRPGRAGAVRGSDPSSWDQAVGRCSGFRPATVQAGPFGRFQQWMCRRHAASEWESDPLDLTAWARIALVHEGMSPAETLSAARIPGIRERWNLGPASDDDPEGILRSIGELLDILLERHGSWTDQDLQREYESRLAARPVDTSGFAFPIDSLAELPEGCGVYRFFDNGGNLLYVGKAVNLARRLRSYFRPYPPERSKREDLMSSVFRFEYDLLSSELEALIRETRLIRTRKPPWNVQIEVSPPETLPPQWWWPLVFTGPGGNAGGLPVFILTGPESGFMLPVPASADEIPGDVWTGWLDSVIAGDAVIGGRAPMPQGVEILDAPESRLALRYYIRHHELLDRVEPCQIPDGSSLLRSIQSLVSRDPTGAGPVLPRPD